VHLWPIGCTGSIHSPSVDRTSLQISGQPAARAIFTHMQLTGPLCAYPANWLHRQHSLACSRPDLSALLWPTSCTGSIHLPAVDRTILHISSQLAVQATFTRLQSTGLLCASPANWLHRQHSLACSRPDLSVHTWPTGCTGSIHLPAVDQPSLQIRVGESVKTQLSKDRNLLV
jgi:hypothetical protein